ncbi:MAG: PhnD/SsuA/transferrin family substrate-binding protein [Chloroflexi bacterium]|nr:PhnD/SsuA/transferrin family substrate-binding protein [Chloroflexota bacterium]
MTRRPLRVATHLAPGVLPAYAYAARRMGDWLTRPAELVVAADYRRCTADVDHVCFVCSIPYLLLEEAGTILMEPVAAPVLRGPRYGGRPVYFSDVVVRSDSLAVAFDDLAGSRWAYNEPYSHSGFMVVLHHLAATGRPAAFLGDWIEAGFHDESLRMVIDGRADWTAIDSQVLAIWLRTMPWLRRRIRIVATLGPSTVQPIVASRRRLSDEQRSLLRHGLMGLGEEASAKPVLHAAGIDRFVAVEASDYDDIRGMLRAVREAGLLPKWWDARWAEVTGRTVAAVS